MTWACAKLTVLSTAPPSVYQYDLFAVVTHEGKLDNGHYWADVLAGDEWWHCDDDKSEKIRYNQSAR